jgi:LysM repeat protein
VICNHVLIVEASGSGRHETRAGCGETVRAGSGGRRAFLGDVIARANAILKPPAPKPTTSTVTVKAGDTLGAIAAAHKLTLRALLAFPQNAKYRPNPGLIHPGDRVRVK